MPQAPLPSPDPGAMSPAGAALDPEPPATTEAGTWLSAPLVSRANLLLPGLYAWGVTVASPAFSRGTGLGPRGLAVLALLLLLAGAAVLERSPRLARGLGILGFAGACLTCWVLLGPALAVTRLDPWRGASGSVAWALFALGWGSVRAVGHVPEKDPRALPGAPLQPRARLARGAALAMGVAGVGALAVVVAAWRVGRPGAAILAQAAAALSALGILAVGARVAVDRGQPREPGSAGERLSRAWVALLVLAGVLAAGLVRLAMR